LLPKCYKYRLIANTIGGNVRLERKEAIALLKELIIRFLVSPSLVAINENNTGDFNLMVKGEYDNQALIEFIDKNKLLLEKNSEKGYLLISKP